VAPGNGDRKKNDLAVSQVTDRRGPRSIASGDLLHVHDTYDFAVFYLPCSPAVSDLLASVCDLPPGGLASCSCILILVRLRITPVR
jgi:hypothetical protein